MSKGCWGTLGVGSTEYKGIKRRLENLTRELKGLGSKPLTSREARLFRKRYKDTISSIEYYKKKISEKENKKLWEKTDEIRILFQHFGFFEMESSVSSSSSDLPSKGIEDNRYNLRSSTTGNDSDLKSSEEHKKSASHEPTSSTSQYLAIKATLENLISNLKDPDLSQKDIHSMQFERIFQDIMTNSSISEEQREDLKMLWNKFQTCLENVKNANEKEQIRHVGISGKQDYNENHINYSVQTYGSWTKSFTEESNCETKNINSKMGKSEVFALSNFNRYNREVRPQEFHPQSKEMNEFAKVHSSGFDCNPSGKAAFFEKEQSKYEEEMECETVPMGEKQTKQTEISHRSVIQDKTLAPNIDGTHLHEKVREEIIPNLSEISKLLELNRNIGSFDFSSERQYSTKENDKNPHSGAYPKNRESEKQDFNYSRKQESVAERLRNNLPPNKDQNCERKQNYVPRPQTQSVYNDSYPVEQVEGKRMLHVPEENSRDRSGSRSLEEMKCSDHAKKSIDSEEARISKLDGMVHHVDRSKNEDLMQESLQDPHYHNNISWNEKINAQISNRSDRYVADRGDGNHYGETYFHEQEAKSKCSERHNLGYKKPNICDNSDNKNFHTSQFRDTHNYQSSKSRENRSARSNMDWNCQYLPEIAEEVKEEEPLQILDVHQYFRDDFDLNSVDSLDIKERIDAIDTYAKTFEPKVNIFDEEKYSLEYFVLDEKLMRLIEKLDKIKSQGDQGLTNKKIEVIEYIKNLHSVLDQRAKE